MKTKKLFALVLVLFLLAGCGDMNILPKPDEQSTEETASSEATTGESISSEVTEKEENETSTTQASTEEDSSEFSVEAGQVMFGYAEDILLTPYDWDPEDSPYETFVLDDGEYCDMIGFMKTEYGTVRDFRFYSLEFVEIEEDATSYFHGHEIHFCKSLSDMAPIFFQIRLEGSIPAYGFSFVNEEGFHSYALTHSGMDGSLTCMEIVLV